MAILFQFLNCCSLVYHNTLSSLNDCGTMVVEQKLKGLVAFTYVSKKTKRPNRYFIFVRRLLPYLIDRRLKKKRKGSKQINRKKSALKEHLRNKVNASFRNASRVG